MTELWIWAEAPKERTPTYFPTYSFVAKRLQQTLRSWVGEWMSAHPEILKRRKMGQSLLLYVAIHPFSGKPTNQFTYDIQETRLLQQAFRSGIHYLKGVLDSIDTKHLDWFTREHYFSYRAKTVVDEVAKNPRTIYQLFNTETRLMDALVKFAVDDIPKMGIEEAASLLRRNFRTHLNRFGEWRWEDRTEELLDILTNALTETLRLPSPGEQLVAALRHAVQQPEGVTVGKETAI